MSGRADQDRKLAELLTAVLDLDPDQRDAYLKEHCHDPEIKRHVTRLLEQEEEKEQVLDAALMTGLNIDLDELARSAEPEKEPERRTIGHYTLEEVLGEGGMGRVYLAYQKEPVKRHVALKIMRHGLSSSADQARFDAERQSLARLNHPNIAQMFEAGATSDGKLFFAMELVRGSAITRYCDHHQFDTWQRLQVFMEALTAVQHAHQNQLLHRDLKPSNILVTDIDGTPIVKVIDFGISLGLDEMAGGARQRGQRAGTPGYSSPESLEPEEANIHLDTRSDIYTLGIVLYELLCGRRPFDEPGDPPREVWRRIAEMDPLHPALQLTSMSPKRLAEVSAARSTRSSTLVRQLRGDLGAIVMKAIRRDRDKRYNSVVAFYADLEDYLDEMPVTAQVQDFTYIAGLFVRRNFGAVLAASLLMCAMALGMIAWSGEARRANLEADRASMEAAQAREALAESRDISRFLVSLFELTGTQSGQPERMTTRELLDLGASNLENMESIDPLDRARLLQLLAEIYTEVYALDQAEEMVRKSLEIRRRELSDNHPEVAESLGQLGEIYRIQMRFEDAEPQLLESLEIARSAALENPAITANAWNRLGNLYWNQERLDEAIVAHERALEIREIRLGGQDQDALAESLYNLGIMLLSRGRYSEATPYLGEAAELYRELLGENHLRTASAYNNLAIAEDNSGRLELAEQHYREAINLWTKIHGPDHPRPMLARETLVRSLGRWGRYLEGVTLGKKALAERISVHGPDHPDIVPAMIALGVNQGNAGDLDGAEQNLNRALDIYAETYGPEHRRTLATMDSLGWLQWKKGDYTNALSTHEYLVRRRLDELGEQHALTAFSQHNLALALASTGNMSQARELMSKALTTWEVVRGPDHRTTAHSLHYLGLIDWNLGQFDLAENWLERALATRTRLFDEDHPDVLRTQRALEAIRDGEPAPNISPDR